ncbi:MAG: ATP-binding protein [Methanomassiliicoccales archaeon]|nr:MAG: ATP-binding protein [Methanomassiliicoccales archaeon]
MTAKKRAKGKRDDNNSYNFSHQMGHILYMAQLTGNLDKKNLVESMPKPERDRYKQAFEILVKKEVLLKAQKRNKKPIFSINPERAEEIKPLISGFVRGTRREQHRRQIPSNPFFHRGPIKDIGHFMGRYDVISHIFDRLRHTEDCSIIGPRAIGKTSLLHFISHNEVVKKYHLDPKKYIFVYYDLQRFGENTQTKDFYYEMFSKTVSQINFNGPLKEEEIKKITKETDNVNKKIGRSLFEISDLETLIGLLSERDYKVVYLFDEFESIANNPNFDFSFYGQLRALSGNPTFQVAFVTASKKSIYTLTFDEEIKTSPFFRYFEDFKLGPMDSEEIGEFFDLAIENGAVFSNKIRTLIEEWSGGHPFLAQLCCDYFFDLVVTGEKIKPSEEEKHLEIFLSRHKKHFAYFWSQVNKKQQTCLWWLASGKRPGSDYEGILEELEQSYLVEKKDGNYRIFSQAFEKFIRDIPFFG